MPKRALSRQEKTSLQLAGGLLLVVLVVSIVQVILAVVMQLAIAAGAIGLLIWSIRQYNQQTLQARTQPPPVLLPPEGPERLNYYFSQLLQKHQGQITILDFALNANLTATQAREYLDQKAREFNADFEGTERGNLVYCFETVETWQATAQLMLDAGQPTALNQTQLARRLNVSPGTISRRKLASNFTQWSQTRDPEGVSWSYQSALKQFVPL